MTPSPTAAPLALTSHPMTPSDAVRALTATARRSSDGRLTVTFRLDADRTRLRLPPPGPPRFAMQLWEHTCFEAFIARAGAAPYHELNLAPSGEWAVFAFTRYRDIAGLGDQMTAPEIAVQRADDHLELSATIRLAELAPELATAPLRIALSAVVERDDGSLSYWALRHPPGKPDFHHPDAFVVELRPPP